MAIVPCRLGSRGIPGKNLRRLGGKTLVALACETARVAGCRVLVTSDATVREQMEWGCNADVYVRRPDELATDDAPMFGVVQEALNHSDGDPVVLVQCTQPLRRPEHITQAIALLRETGADSVVSVVALPLTHSPEMHLWIHQDRLYRGPRMTFKGLPMGWDWDLLPPRRQDVEPTYIRDGTCYTFRRETVIKHGNIYGERCVPLVIRPDESCELDTEEDWSALVRRWQERESVSQLRDREASD